VEPYLKSFFQILFIFVLLLQTNIFAIIRKVFGENKWTKALYTIGALITGIILTVLISNTDDFVFGNHCILHGYIVWFINLTCCLGFLFIKTHNTSSLKRITNERITVQYFLQYFYNNEIDRIQNFEWYLVLISLFPAMCMSVLSFVVRNSNSLECESENNCARYTMESHFMYLLAVAFANICGTYYFIWFAVTFSNNRREQPQYGVENNLIDLKIE